MNRGWAKPWGALPAPTSLLELRPDLGATHHLGVAWCPRPRLALGSLSLPCTAQPPGPCRGPCPARLGLHPIPFNDRSRGPVVWGEPWSGGSGRPSQIPR